MESDNIVISFKIIFMQIYTKKYRQPGDSMQTEFHSWNEALPPPPPICSSLYPLKQLIYSAASAKRHSCKRGMGCDRHVEFMQIREPLLTIAEGYFSPESKPMSLEKTNASIPSTNVHFPLALSAFVFAFFHLGDCCSHLVFLCLNHISPVIWNWHEILIWHEK